MPKLRLPDRSYSEFWERLLICTPRRVRQGIHFFDGVPLSRLRVSENYSCKVPSSPCGEDRLVFLSGAPFVLDSLTALVDLIDFPRQA